MAPRGNEAEQIPLSPVDLHVMMVLWEGPLYGYAIMKAVADESHGAVAPQIGSLYRVLGRLVSKGWVVETDAPASGDGTHPGKDRRYYGLTDPGRMAARAEAERLKGVVALAQGRDMLSGRGRG